MSIKGDKMINAFLYKPEYGLMTLVELPKGSRERLQELYRMLECSSIDIVHVSKDLEIIIDDEGLFKSGNLVSHLNIDGKEFDLAGSLVFVGGADSNGNLKSIDADSFKDQIQGCISLEGIVS